MSFTRLAGFTHETGICNHLVPDEECREASRKQTARSGSHVRPVSCDRAGDARWVAPRPAAVALPDVLRPGLEVTGVSRRPMSFNRHPGSTHVGGICNPPDTRGEGMNIPNKTSLITGANRLSVVALAPVPVIPGYSISKAAALNMTQAMRALLAGQSVSVHAVFLGPIDTDMNRGFDIPKAPTEVAARGIFDGLERGEEDIFPDPMSQSIAEGWRASAAKALERQFAAFVPQSAAAA